ncbi:MAG: hypothetical protein KAI24_14320 [Planctomycetes bacterium]|nr:hypothetical protein [Planctomycetota bacterium]
MKQSKQVWGALAFAGAIVVSSCSNGGAVSNAAPRITAVPMQSTTGGTALSVDLSSYVSDREGAPLAYSVTSGGGSFSGSTYSNTFDTIGEYDVTFAVSDGSKTETATFEVQVTSAEVALVREDTSGLLVLDTQTNSFARLAGTVPQPYFVAQVGTRYVLYTVGLNGALWVHDLYTRVSRELATAEDGDATYLAKTTDGKVVYCTGSAPDISVWYYNPFTDVARLVGQAVATPTVLVNTDGYVFFEAGASGQSDIAFYEPDDDETVTVSAATTDEQLLATTANGGVVFSRVGGSGETDLYYYRPSVGLVEIGASYTGLPDRDKAYQLTDSNSKVVFTAQNGGNDELFFWNPSNGQTTAIATGIDTEVFATLGSGNELVYYDVRSTTEYDAYYYDLDDGTAATLRDSTDYSRVSAVVSDGTTSWAVIRPDGATSTKLAVSLVASPSTQTWSAGGAAELGALLANGDYVAERSDGTAINVFDVSAGTWGTPITGTGLDTAGDGLEAGDFVYRVEVSSQDDLMMWDASGTTSVTISSAAGDDAYAAKAAGAAILFTRRIGAATTDDLFTWDGTTATQLTGTASVSSGVDHTVLSTLSASR